MRAILEFSVTQSLGVGWDADGAGASDRSEREPGAGHAAGGLPQQLAGGAAGPESPPGRLPEKDQTRPLYY